MIKKQSNDKQSAEEVVFEVMRHFGYRRNYQVAEYFSVTPQTLSGWIKSGEIPPKHLIKYNNEIFNINQSVYYENNETTTNSSFEAYNSKNENISISEIISTLFKNIKLIIAFTMLSMSLSAIYVYIIANPSYTSRAKVLPISEDGNSSSSFSGFASQLGINIPLSMGGKVPWDEIYPEILKSSNLLESALEDKYSTKKYGESSLLDIIINEYGLSGYNEQNQKNRALNKLREMIKINKDRTSPIVNIEISTFEPVFSHDLSNQLISKSSIIQRELKTNRIKQKRLFIEERLDQVSREMKAMEKELRLFRENNRVISTPTLEMKVQEMGRELDLQSTLYVTLKTQYEKAKIDEVGRDDMVQKIDGPSIPFDLTSPRRLLSITMSFFFGLFLSIITIYLK